MLFNHTQAFGLAIRFASQTYITLTIVLNSCFIFYTFSKGEKNDRPINTSTISLHTVKLLMKILIHLINLYVSQISLVKKIDHSSNAQRLLMLALALRLDESEYP